MPRTTAGGLSGRKAEAARNDQVIVDAARQVFIADPAAPMSAVAQAAGVGISALYRRYASKDDLLQTLCAGGLRDFIAIARAAETAADPWSAFAAFVTGVVDSDVHALTVRLAGTFAPSAELHLLAAEAARLGDQLFDQAKKAGVLRADLRRSDVPMIFEQLTAVRLGDTSRTRALRRRYLALWLDGLRPEAAVTPLPGTPPAAAELSGRWVTGRAGGGR
jgi:AcrR family transcriptional regulator